jgi:hypothetical protein
LSVANLLKDIVTGNFTSAEQRIKDGWTGVSPRLQSFITQAEMDQGKILENLAATGAQDVLNGGLTTASFVAAALDIEAKGIAMEASWARTTIFAFLNIAVGDLQAQTAGTLAAKVKTQPKAVKLPLSQRQNEAEMALSIFSVARSVKAGGWLVSVRLPLSALRHILASLLGTDATDSQMRMGMMM